MKIRIELICDCNEPQGIAGLIKSIKDFPEAG